MSLKDDVSPATTSGAMRVKVRFSGALPSLLNVPTSQVDVETVSGSTLADVMRLLGVPEGNALLYAVNGRLREAGFQPGDGDEITAMAAMAGG